MSELNTRIRMRIRSSQLQSVPVDDTLSIEGQAADAKAVGDALAQKADLSAVVTISVDGQEADAQGLILLYAGDIPMSEESQVTVGDAIDAVDRKTAADIPVSGDPEAKTIAQALAESVDKTAADIVMSESDGTKVKDRIEALEASAEGVVRSVNNNTPDDTGNVLLNRVPFADNLLSSGSQGSEGEFLIRSTGGDASIADGDARIMSIRGMMEHSGFVPEVLEMIVNGSNITAELDRSTFIQAVTGDTEITLSYTTEWSADPATYGVTVSGTPASGDTIVITYVQEIRGTITPSNPQSFVSTGWNLYNRGAGYARVVNYSDSYGYRVGGSFTTISFSTTVDGDRTLLTVTNRGCSLPAGAADGYVFITGADDTTDIYMTWSDWTSQANGGVHENYTQSVINLAGVMAGAFPDGMFRIGDVYDEISFNDRKTYSRIERMDYSEENRQYADDTGRAYVFDEYYIYLARESAEETTLAEGMGKYTANGHGTEIITGGEIAPEIQIVYSNDLKNKLERDVLTISQQTLKNAQKRQARTNIGALAMSDLNGIFKTVTYSYNYSIEAGGYLTITKTQLGITDPEGYTLIGLVGFNTRSQYTIVSRIYPGMESMVFLVNTRNSVTAQTFSIRLLYAKSSLVS